MLRRERKGRYMHNKYTIEILLVIVQEGKVAFQLPPLVHIIVLLLSESV